MDYSLLVPLLRNSCVSVLRVAQGNRQPDTTVCISKGSLESVRTTLAQHTPLAKPELTPPKVTAGGDVSFHTAILFTVRFIILSLEFEAVFTTFSTGKFTIITGLQKVLRPECQRNMKLSLGLRTSQPCFFPCSVLGSQITLLEGWPCRTLVCPRRCVLYPLGTFFSFLVVAE